MTIDHTSPRCPAVIVAGMHRSGTSLTASLLLDAGIHMGDSLLGAGHGNPVGHFEDNAIYEFHQRALVANGLGSEGFTTQAGLVVPPALLPDAQRLVTDRRRHGGPWGWKEPRTTLFLDFWADLIPEAMFLLVFRRPWEVVDSLFRRGDPTFALNPRMVVDVWMNYAAHIERFLARHPDRCLLVELSQIVPDPTAFLDRVRKTFGIRIDSTSDRFQEELLVQDAASDRARLLDAVDPAILDCYRRLRERAGSDSDLPAGVRHRPTTLEVGGPALAEWQRAAAADSQAAAAAASLLTERNFTEQAQAELKKIHEYAAAVALELQRLQDAHANVLEIQAQRERTSELAEQAVREKESLLETLAVERRNSQRAQQDLLDQLAASTAAVTEVEGRLFALQQELDRERDRTAAVHAELEATRRLQAKSAAVVKELRRWWGAKAARLSAKIRREIRRVRDQWPGTVRTAGEASPISPLMVGPHQDSHS